MGVGGGIIGGNEICRIRPGGVRKLESLILVMELAVFVSYDLYDVSHYREQYDYTQTMNSLTSMA